MQLGVFAAPRNEGIWDDVRDEITKRLSQQRMASVYEDYVEGLRKASEKTTQTTVSEVSLTVPNVPTSTLSGPGLGPAPAKEGGRKPSARWPLGIDVTAETLDAAREVLAGIASPAKKPARARRAAE